MAAATIATTEAPGGQQPAGFPPFKTETYPSQIFWLVITFGFLFLVLWRVAGPRIGGVIAARRGAINADIEAARKARGDADAAETAYRTALAGARARAQGLAEETRQKLAAEIAAEKARADAEAAQAMAAADARIAATREAARGHVAQAARDAAAAIVARLIGDTVSPDEAAAAVQEG